MKKLISICLLISALGVSGFAQPGNPEARKQKLEAFRVAFFTEKLSLNEDEAKSFWPIWDEYRDARKKLHDQYETDKDIDSMSDKEVEDFIYKSIEEDQKELDLKKEYLGRLRKVLPPRKVARLQGIERDFKEELIKRIQKKASKLGEGGDEAPLRPRAGGRRNR